MCICISYSPIDGKPREPYQRMAARLVFHPLTGAMIPIDECIADTMAFLWRKGIETASCCCGHNEGKPTCILRNPNAGDKEYKEVRELIKESGDKRDWVFLPAPDRPSAIEGW